VIGKEVSLNTNNETPTDNPLEQVDRVTKSARLSMMFRRFLIDRTKLKLNDPHEAYTGKHAGHRGKRTPLKSGTAPLITIMQMAMFLT
jgi:hypothetical protein